jgi:hypothetical protein
MLERIKLSGLDEEDAKKLHFQPYSEAQSASLGLPRPGVGFKIPYYSMDGELLKMYRFRYRDTEVAGGFTKGAKLAKYAQPKDTPVEAYFPAIAAWSEIKVDITKGVILTEGELKAACATKMGMPTIGLGGVFSFGSKQKYHALIPSLKSFPWEGRQVSIVFDSDAVMNPQVMLAEMRLAQTLTDVGASVFVMRIPQVGKEKIGLDDFLMKHGMDGFDDLSDQTKEYAGSAALYKLNMEIVYIRHPSMVVEFAKPGQPKDQTNYHIMRVGAFRDEVYANRKHLTANGRGDVVEHHTAKDWVEWPARATLDSVAYVPGVGKIVDNQQLNLWEGWGAAPEKGDVSLFMELLDFVFKGAEKDHRKWFLQWAAYPLQNPGVKLNTAVVLWSVLQGVGKSLVGYTLGRIYGKNYIEVGKQDLVGSFNAWQAHKQFVLGDEITGGDSREVADRLKSIITAPTVSVNVKFQPEYTIENHCNYMFTSQHQDAFFITTEDRRYFIHEVTEKAPPTFFARYDRWFNKQEAIDAVFDYLLHIDLAGFNPMAEAPRTKSRNEMVEAGKSEHAAWVSELKEFPGNKLRVGDVELPYSLFTVEELLALYQPEDGTVRRRYPVTGKAMNVALKEAGFRMAAGGAAIETTKGRRQRVWCVRACDEGMTQKQAAELYNQERSRKGEHKKKFVKE